MTIHRVGAGERGRVRAAGGNDGVESPEAAEWRRFLVEGHRGVRLSHRLFGRLPGDPRCKLCHNPFGGRAGKAFALIGCTPSRSNPSFCTRCLEKLPRGGTRVDVAVLFADIRGSTALGERSSPEAYAALLNAFYRTASRVLIAHDAIIDKIVGDEVMALFVPGFAGPDYRARAARAAIELVRAIDRETGLPAGAAVNAGEAFVGSVGSEHVVDLTAVGDTVNTAARLQGHAGAGQVVLADDLPAVPGAPAGERLSLELRGRSAPVAVRRVAV